MKSWQGILLGLIIFFSGVGSTLVLLNINSPSRNEIYYPESCLTSDSPSFWKYNPSEIFQGSLKTILVCGLESNQTYNIGTTEKDYYFENKLSAHYIILSINELPEDGITIILLIKDHFVYDSWQLAVIVPSTKLCNCW